MLKKIMLSLLLILIIFPTNLLADTATIKMEGELTYKGIQLNPEIYNKANRNLNDILILDNEDEPVPYFINSFQTVVNNNMEKNYEMELVGSFKKDKDNYYDYYYEGVEGVDTSATSIRFQSDIEFFAKSVEILGSYDGENWTFVQRDRLFRVDGDEKLSINFQDTQKYEFYRVKVINNAENLKFSKVILNYNQVSVERAYFTDKIYPEFTQEEDGKYTVLKLYGLTNVKLDTVILSSKDQYKREAYFGSYSKNIYNLTFSNSFYNDNTLNFNGYVEPEEYVLIRIFNGDDQPIEVADIQVNYFFDEVIFKDTGSSSYKLFFNDNTVNRSPTYDIVNYKDLIIGEGYDVLKIEKIVTEVEEVVESPFDYGIIFNGIIIVVSLLLCFIIISRVKLNNN